MFYNKWLECIIVTYHYLRTSLALLKLSIKKLIKINLLPLAGKEPMNYDIVYRKHSPSRNT